MWNFSSRRIGWNEYGEVQKERKGAVSIEVRLKLSVRPIAKMTVTLLGPTPPPHRCFTTTPLIAAACSRRSCVFNPVVS